MHCHMALNSKSWAHPPLGEVSRLHNTDGASTRIPLIALPHFPDLPNGVSRDVILQYGVSVNPITPGVGRTIPATCNYYNYETNNI